MSTMPVEDLIRYFNTADHAGDSLLYAKAERVEAWYNGLRLSSLFEPIIDLSANRIVGHRASLHAEREDGTPVDSLTPFAFCETEQSVIHLDRLCRTLHALNFLAQQRSTGGWLQLAVHPRHLLAVPNQHGLVYEAILKRCGLAPEDIVLELDGGARDTYGRFAQALDNYRQRGYRLALHLESSKGGPPAALELRPDYVRLSNAHPEFAQTARSCGIVRQLTGIDDESAQRSATRLGIELATGQLFGSPARDCQPTHKTAVTPYNLPSSRGVPHENRQ